ncbi:MAG: tetratricopeptide repeat protein [Bacteroides sp.]|nr:tetratricopeptide repeat protein [Bacteroides sp.]
MKKKNFLTDKEREMVELTESYESALSANKPLYMDADDLADLADWYAMHLQKEKAMQVVEYGLKIHPNNTTLFVEQAYLYLDDQERDKAKEILASIKEETSEAIILKANILMGEGHEEAAEELLNNLTSEEDLGNIIDIVYMYMDMDQPQKALDWLVRGEALYGENENILGLSADCFYALQDFDKAINLFNKMIDNNPYSTSAWMGLARCHFDMGDYEKVLEDCDYALVADDEFAEAYIMRGQVYAELDNEEAAINDYKKAISLKAIPENIVDTFIGINRTRQSKWEEGYEHLSRAIALSSSKGDEDPLSLYSIHINAAVCLMNMNQKQKALEHCQLASELVPEEIGAYLLQGRIHIELDEFEKGLKCWAKALRYAPYPATWYEIGIYSMELGMLENAQKAFERVADMDSSYEDVNERLAAVCLLRSDKEGFLRYNLRCHNPIPEEELQRFESFYESNDMKQLSEILKHILKKN